MAPSWRIPSGRLAPVVDAWIGLQVRLRRRLSAASRPPLRRLAGWINVAVAALAASVRRVASARRREPLPERPLVAVAVLVVGGGWSAAACTLPLAVWLVMAAIALSVWGATWRRRWDNAAASALATSIVCAMAAWTTLRLDHFPADDLGWCLDDTARPVAVEGVVSAGERVPARIPDAAGDPLTPARDEYRLVIRAVRDGAAWRPAAGRARLTVAEPTAAPAGDGVRPGAGRPALDVGATVRVFGRALRPPPPLNPGEFDQRRRARLEGVLSLIRADRDDIVVVAPPPPWSPYPWLARLRAAGDEALATHVAPRRAPLAAALLLGSRGALDAGLARGFLVTGTVHILSISGLHVGILAAALGAVLRAVPVPRAMTLLVVPLITGGYALLVGAETPVVRATLVVWLACLAAVSGRPGSGINALAIAALVVAIARPTETLLVGTQLSFLSTAVLIAVVTSPRQAAADPLERIVDAGRTPLWRRCVRGGRVFRAALLAGAAVWLATAPVVAARFHVVSPVALVLNPLLAPLVTMAMGWGFLCMVTAPWSTPVAALCGRVCDAALTATEWTVGAAAALPGGHAWVVGPAEWWVVGGYGLTLALLVWLPVTRLRQPRTWITLAAGWLAVGAAIEGGGAWLRRAPAGLEVVVASMGHGCGIVLHGAAGRCLVYDAGRMGAPLAACRGLEGVLLERGVRRIDTLMISHADADHFNAVPELLSRFEVGAIVVPPSFPANPSAGVAALLARARAAGVPVRIACGGADVPFEPSCRIRVLHPDGGDDPSDGDDNQSSLVVAVEAAGRRILLTGDLDGAALARFVASRPGTCDALVAPHHGSLSALGTGIVAATLPRWVLVSGAAGDRWERVRDAYRTAAGGDATVLRSAVDGAIAIRVTAAALDVRQFREGRWQAVGGPASTPLTRVPSPATTANRRPRAATGWPRGT
ncbi:MAG: ComEC/Rec2 family competence protein [Planctomycetaceae bacterium]